MYKKQNSEKIVASGFFFFGQRNINYEDCISYNSQIGHFRGTEIWTNEKIHTLKVTGNCSNS